MFKNIICLLAVMVACFNQSFSDVLPSEIEYNVIKVQKLEDLQKTYDGNYVFSLDGLDLDSLTIPAKKEAFVSLMLPNIEQTNREIKRDMEIVEILSKKTVFSQSEQREIDRIFANYKIKMYDWDKLKSRMIIYPTSLILSQAAIESGWGTSNVFLEKTNLFGMNLYKHKSTTYKTYPTIKESVKDFVLTLSRVNAYSDLREKVHSGESAKDIAYGLLPYSELKHAYVAKVHTMLRQNQFEKYD